MTEEAQVQSQSGVGTSGGPVAGDRDRESLASAAASGAPAAAGAEQQQSATGERAAQEKPEPEAVAKRLNQERERVDRMLRTVFGTGLEEVRQLYREGQQAQQGEAAPQPAASPAELNRALQDMLLENPAAVIQATVQATLQAVSQQVLPLQTKLVRSAVRDRHPDFDELAPVVDEILKYRSDLAASEQGVEWAYYTAKGLLADELASSAAQQARAEAEQTARQRVHAAPTAGQVAQQGGKPESPEERLKHMILEA